MEEFVGLLNEQRLRKIYNKTRNIRKRSKSWTYFSSYSDLVNDPFWIEIALTGALRRSPSSLRYGGKNHSLLEGDVMFVLHGPGLVGVCSVKIKPETYRNLMLAGPISSTVVLFDRGGTTKLGYSVVAERIEGPLRETSAHLGVERTRKGRWKVSLKVSSYNGVKIDREAQHLINQYIARMLANSSMRSLHIYSYPNTEHRIFLSLGAQFRRVPTDRELATVHELLSMVKELNKDRLNLSIWALRRSKKGENLG